MMRNQETTIRMLIGWLTLAVGLMALPTMAEVVDLGSTRVERYGATDSEAASDYLALGEVVDGAAQPLRVQIAGHPSELRLSMVQAKSVHQLLGHILAMAAPDTPSGGGQTDGQPDAGDDSGSGQGTAKQTPGDQGDGPSEPIYKNRNFLGMNLADVTYYSRAWVFTDLALQSDAWRDNGWGYIFKSGNPPEGLYTCTWSGSGSIKFHGDVSVQSSTPNSAQIMVTAGKRGIDMQRVGDVGTVSMMRFDHEARASVFHPIYLKRLEPFSVLRFMDWANINNTRRKHWEQRTQPGDSPQAGSNGVAIEHMIAISNELGADPWFCMPHLADDDYVRRYAELVKERLHGDATIYLEYSNEVWNTQFKQHGYIKDISDSKTFSNAFFDAWAGECRRVFAIWSDVFGDEADTRLVRVVAVHLQNPWVAQQLVPRLEGEFDAISPSAYFGYTYEQSKKLGHSTTVDDILDLCEKNIKEDNRGWYEAHGQLAKKWSSKLGRPIRLVAYEGGQHLSAHGDEQLPYYDGIIQAQSHRRMYGLYLLNMRYFEAAGGDLYVAFNDVGKPGKFGSWGHLEYQDQPTNQAMKYKALLDYPLMDAK